MTALFAMRMVEGYAEIRAAGMRDVENPALAPFHGTADVPASETAARTAAANAALAQAGSPALSTAAYATQAGPGAAAFFVDVVQACGVERVYTDDLTVDESGEPHLTEPPVVVLADADEFVRPRVSAARDFVRRLLRPAE